MGRRREKRIPIRFPIRVSGVDKDGNPFSQDAETVDISRSGARIRWIGCLRKGQTATVQYAREKAQFKVAWVGLEGSGEVGLQCMERRYIWGTALPSDTTDDFDISQVAPEGSVPFSTAVDIAPPWAGEERRTDLRYPCTGSVELVQKDTTVRLRGGLSDLSRKGCYVDTLTPLPSGTEVNVSVEVSGKVIEAEAVVRASHTSVGMGLEFLRIEGEARKHLEHVVARLRGEDQVVVERTPEPTPPSPAALTSAEAAAVLQALIELLESKGVLTRQELQQAIEKVKAAATPPS